MTRPMVTDSGSTLVVHTWELTAHHWMSDAMVWIVSCPSGRVDHGDDLRGMRTPALGE